MRAVQLEKQLAISLKMVPMLEGVAMPMVTKLFDEKKIFHSNEVIDNSAVTMLDELCRWSKGLRNMRLEH